VALVASVLLPVVVAAVVLFSALVLFSARGKMLAGLAKAVED